MRTKIIVILYLITISSLAFSQEYIFFNDNLSGNFYNSSWGYVNSPSYLELLGPDNNKFPISTDIFYSGLNSLKLNWKSLPGGNWAVAVAESGWPGHDVTIVDSLRLRAYSEFFISELDLPKIFLEDLTNSKTEKVELSDYTNDITAQTWITISIPLQEFINKPGGADLSKIKTIFFEQNTADATIHTLYLDEIIMFSSVTKDSIPPLPPQNLYTKAFEKHIELYWDFNQEDDIAGYRIYKLDGLNFIPYRVASPSERLIVDFIDSSNVSNSYKLKAYDNSLNESDFSPEVSASTYQMSDDEFLTMVQEATFRYFWDYAHPVSGLIRERLGSGNTVTIGGSGFGIMAIMVGVERGFISRTEATNRILKILNFLNTKADRFHGAYSHWLNGETGKVIPFSQKDNGGDLVETAFLAQGILALRVYFDQNNSDEELIREISTSIWESIEWDWYLRYQSSNFLYWHWSPEYNWDMNMVIRGPNETMIAYLLAIASPTHPVPHSTYSQGWASSNYYINGKSFYGYPLYVGWDYGGPLFFAHYSFLGFDPREKKDSYTNYFLNNRNHTLINRAYCIANPKGYAGYSENIWGLTASDDPITGYAVHEPISIRDNGTISPTAALSSFPYTPDESMGALKSFYRNYGKQIWGIYGFKDAFNLQRDWVANSYLAIDQGPIICMIENYRSNLLWNNFMANAEIETMMDLIGFQDDLTKAESIEDITRKEIKLSNNYPNPFNPSTTIEYTVPSLSGISNYTKTSSMSTLNDKINVKLTIHDILGREVATLVDEQEKPGIYEVKWNANNQPSGVYIYQLKAGDFIEVQKMLLLK